MIAATLHQLGTVAHEKGEIDHARKLYNESLDINTKRGDANGIAMNLGQLANLAEGEGDIMEAARLFGEVLVILENLGSPDAEIARRGLERIRGKVPQ